MNEIIFLIAGCFVGFLPFLLVYSRDTHSMKELRKAHRKKIPLYIFHDYRGNTYFQTADVVKGTLNQLDVENKHGVKLLTRNPTDVEFIDGETKSIHYLVESVYSLSTEAAGAYCSIHHEFEKRGLQPTPERIILLMEAEWEIMSCIDIYTRALNERGTIATTIEQLHQIREIWEETNAMRQTSGPFVYSAAKDFLHSGGQNTSVAFSAWKTKIIEMVKSGQSTNGSLFGKIDIKTIGIIGVVVVIAFLVLQSGALSSLGGIF